MLNVSMITGSFPPDKCGVGDYSKLLTDKLRDTVNINIITSKQYGLNDDDSSIKRVVDKWGIGNIRIILNQLKLDKPNIIHIQYPTKNYERKIMINFLPVILKMKKHKVIMTIHEYSDSSKLGKIRTLIGAFFADSLIVVDERYKKDIKKVGLFKRKKIDYINIASNIPKSTLKEPERILKRKKYLDNEEQKIMSYFGFIHEKKGVESIIKAMDLLNRKNILKSKLLIIADLREDDEYQKKVLHLIDEYNLKDYIIITGYVKDYEVANYLNISDFSVFPFVDGASTKNGSLLAALQEGNKVITTESKDLDFKIDNIVLIPRFDSIDELAKSIEALQDNSEKVNKSTKTYQWSTIAKKHKEIYMEVLND